jgi:hypothetical protein
MRARFAVLVCASAFLFAYGEGQAFAQQPGAAESAPENPFKGQKAPGKTGGAKEFTRASHALRYSPMAYKLRKTGQGSMLSHPAFGKQARKDCKADRAQFCPNVRWFHGAAKCLNGQVMHLSAVCAHRVAAVCKKNQCPPELLR